MTSFPMPIGPKADLAELEYVATLHQTVFPELRKNASISASDISLYLRSRYGIQINDEAAQDIVRGLGGFHRRECVEGSQDESVTANNITHVDPSKRYGTEDLVAENVSPSFQEESIHRGENDENELKECDDIYLDLVQWMAALFIPTILKGSDEANRKEHLDDEMRNIRQTLRDIDHDTVNDLFDVIHKSLKKRQCLNDLQKARDKYSLEIDERMLPLAFQNLIESLGIEDKGSSEEIVLTKDLVKSLLVAHGEKFNEDLLQQMVDCTVIDKTGGEEIHEKFNLSSFITALTHDINLYETGIEDKVSTTFFDVFHSEPIEVNKNNIVGEDNDVNECSNAKDDEGGGFHYNSSSIHSSNFGVSHHDPDCERPDEDSTYHRRPERAECKPHYTYVPTAPYIDYVVDSQQGVVFLMLLWVYFIFSVMVYMIFINAFAYNIIPCSPSFACELVNRIWSWMCLGIILCLGGIILMVPISIANDPYRIDCRRAAISATFIIVFTFLPYIGIDAYRRAIPHGPNERPNELDLLVTSRWVETATHLYLSFGVFLLLTNAIRFLFGTAFNCEEQESLGTIGKLFLSREVTGSAAVKLAATRKINRLLQNSMGLHTNGHKNIVAQRFHSCTGQVEDCGGIIWTWKQILTHNKLLQDHGVWIHSRLAVGQEGQIIAYAFLIGLLIYETEILAREADEFISFVDQEEPGPLKPILLSYLPAGWIIRRSFSTGIGFAAAIGVALIVLYLPSSVSTTLQLRSGVLSSMQDKNFQKYRYSADTTFYNVGELVFYYFMLSYL